MMTTTTNPAKGKAPEAMLPAEAEAIATDLSAFVAKVSTDTMTAIGKLIESAAPIAAGVTKLANDWHAARVALVPTAKRASAAKLHEAMTAAGKLNGVTSSDVTFMLALPASKDDRTALKIQYQTRCMASKPRRLPTWPGFVAFVVEGASFAKANPGFARFNPDGSDSAKYLANRAAAVATAEAKSMTKITRRNYTSDEHRRYSDDAYALALAIARHVNDATADLNIALSVLPEADQRKIAAKVRAEVKAKLELATADVDDDDATETTDDDATDDATEIVAA